MTDKVMTDEEMRRANHEYLSERYKSMQIFEIMVEEISRWYKRTGPILPNDNIPLLAAPYKKRGAHLEF